MNICLISREFPPFVGGGIGTYTRSFARALSRHGHRPVVVTVSETGRQERVEEDGVLIVRLPFLEGRDWSGPHPVIRTPESLAAFHAFGPISVFAMQVAAALPGLVRELDIEVIEAPDTGALAWFALNERELGRALERGGKPVAFVTHFHSPTALIDRGNRTPCIDRQASELRRMERDSARWSDGLVSPSAAIGREAEALFGLDAGSVAAIPLPLGDLAQEPIPARGGRKGPRAVLFAGRLEPRKGIDMLLASFAEAVSGGAELVLHLAGDDAVDPRTGERFGARALARMPRAARRNIKVHGKLKGRALARLRARVDAAAVPSLVDIFPYTCIEAMASGLPVIGARCAGIGEMVRDGADGRLSEPGDIKGLAESLRWVAGAEQSELEEMGRSARGRIVDLCDNHKVVGARLEHYERAVAAADRRAGSRVASGAGPVVVVNPGPNRPELLRGLAEVLERGAGDFVHGWAKGGGVPRIRAHGTPSAEGLAWSGGVVGPVAVREGVLGRVAGEAGLAEARELEGVRVAEADGDSLVRALLGAGAEGLVAPGVVLRTVHRPDGWVPFDPGLCRALGPALAAEAAALDREAAEHPERAARPWRERAREAEAELDGIRGSRGWALLRGVYALLHVLRGRGLPAKGQLPRRR